MNSGIPEEDFFERLAGETESAPEGSAPARLKSRLYSALVLLQAETGPLLSLSQTQAAGHGLCVFEQLVQIAPVGESVKSLNPCRVCQARGLAEWLVILVCLLVRRTNPAPTDR